MARTVQRGVGPVERHVVGQGHVPSTQVVIGPKRTEGILDRVAALHAEQGRDFLLLLRVYDVVGGEGEHQTIGIAGNHPARDVELLELHPGKPAVLDLPGDIDGPELCSDPTLGEAREIGHPFARSTEVIRRNVAGSAFGGSDFPGEVVMPVDQYGLLEQFLRMSELRVGLGHEGRDE